MQEKIGKEGNCTCVRDADLWDFVHSSRHGFQKSAMTCFVSVGWLKSAVVVLVVYCRYFVLQNHRVRCDLDDLWARGLAFWLLPCNEGLLDPLVAVCRIGVCSQNTHTYTVGIRFPSSPIHLECSHFEQESLNQCQHSHCRRWTIEWTYHCIIGELSGDVELHMHRSAPTLAKLSWSVLGVARSGSVIVVGDGIYGPNWFCCIGGDEWNCTEESDCRLDEWSPWVDAERDLSWMIARRAFWASPVPRLRSVSCVSMCSGARFDARIVFCWELLLSRSALE